MDRMQFEAGEGRHFPGGVNFIQGSGIYAEIEALLHEYPALSECEWWYDGQEDKLAEDAYADVKIYTECEDD